MVVCAELAISSNVYILHEKREERHVKVICVCLGVPGEQSCSLIKPVKHLPAREVCLQRMHMQKPCQHVS